VLSEDFFADEFLAARGLLPGDYGSYVALTPFQVFARDRIKIVRKLRLWRVVRTTKYRQVFGSR
jgi:hypothetical protein